MYIGIDGVARKITKAYIGIDGVARLFYSSGVDIAGIAVSYTGAYTDQKEVIMSGKKYRLLTLTGSGTLTLGAEVKADVWMCEGGSGGSNAKTGIGGGGGAIRKENNLYIQSEFCIIGYGGTTNGGIGGYTSFGQYSTYESYAIDGSGGGSAYGKTPGTGGGSSTVPFGETTIFSPHCAGGGGPSYATYTQRYDRSYSGGNGGSDGASGEAGSGYVTNGDANGGSGGNKGGGKGGYSYSNGGAATYYGSGGGGGGWYSDSVNDETSTYAGGTGYQGVIYVRIPYEQ